MKVETKVYQLYQLQENSLLPRQVETMKQVLVIMLLGMMSAGMSCKKANDATPTEFKNVSYGSDPVQKMDIYLPANRNSSSTKAMIMIHGGAWISGDKSDFDSVVNYFRTQLPDYAFFNINYRLATLSGGNAWPVPIEDINAAFNYINTNSGEYEFNADKIVVAGASAGAHLALLKAYKFNTGGKIKAVVDLFGPTDIKAMYNYDVNYSILFNNFFSGTPATNAFMYQNASPLFDVTSSSPPTIIFHGGIDAVVPKLQSDSLYNRLINANVAREYHVYPAEGHGWYGSTTLDTYAKIFAFIKQHNQ